MATKAFWLTAVLAFALLTAACPQRTSIADIENNPSRYYDKTVAVAGTVENSYGVSLPAILIGGGRRGASGGGMYKIDDGTGEIWVVTERGVPQKGAQLGVKGKIQNGVTINGRNYGLVLIEDDRRFGKR